MSTGQFNVRHYGVKGEGASSGDAAATTTLVNALIAKINAQGGGQLYFPAGVYYMSGAPTVFTTGSVTVKGDGVGATTIYWTGTGANQTLFKFWQGGAGTDQLNYCYVRELSIITTETTYTKTAVEFYGSSRCGVNDLRINCYGVDSVALRTRGHESFSCRDVGLYANVPIRISANSAGGAGYGGAPQGWLSADHFNFHNCLLVTETAPQTLVHACVLIDAEADLNQLSFTGSQPWVGGSYGLYWRYTFNPLAYSTFLVLENVRTEQMILPKYSVYVENAVGSDVAPLRNLILRNCELNEVAGGVFAKGVNCITLDSCLLAQSSTPILTMPDIYGADGYTSPTSVEIVNSWLNSQSLANAIDLPSYMRPSSGMAGHYSIAQQVPISASWKRVSATLQFQPPDALLAGSLHWGETMEIAAGSTQALPLNMMHRNLSLVDVDIVVRGITRGSTAYAVGRYYVMPTEAGGAGPLTANGVVGRELINAVVGGAPAAGQIGVSAAVAYGGADVVLHNNMGETVLAWIRSQAIDTYMQHRLRLNEGGVGSSGWWVQATGNQLRHYENGGFTNPADTTKFLFSVWAKYHVMATSSAIMRLMGAASALRLSVYKATNDHIEVVMNYVGGGSVTFNTSQTGTGITVGAAGPLLQDVLYHVMVSGKKDAATGENFLHIRVVRDNGALLTEWSSYWGGPSGTYDNAALMLNDLAEARIFGHSNLACGRATYGDLLFTERDAIDLNTAGDVKESARRRLYASPGVPRYLGPAGTGATLQALFFFGNNSRVTPVPYEAGFFSTVQGTDWTVVGGGTGNGSNVTFTLVGATTSTASDYIATVDDILVAVSSADANADTVTLTLAPANATVVKIWQNPRIKNHAGNAEHPLWKGPAVSNSAKRPLDAP